MARLFVEALGTLMLVFLGCGAAVLNGQLVGPVGIALAFGFALTGVIYGLGPISGAHVNPAVSLAMFVAGRMSAGAMLAYWLAQFFGALTGASLLAAIAGTAGGLAENGWGPGYLGEYPLIAAALFEIAGTALFVAVVLGATSKDAPTAFAGLAIGLTLAAIHIAGIHVTGVSVNPARSFGPAILLGGMALDQLWLFIVAPAAGAVIAALPFRNLRP